MFIVLVGVNPPPTHHPLIAAEAENQRPSHMFFSRTLISQTDSIGDPALNLPGLPEDTPGSHNLSVSGNLAKP